MSHIPASPMESLRQLTTILAAQKKKQNEFLKNGVKIVPVEDEVLEKLTSVVVGDEFGEIMSCHPGYDLDGKIKSLQRSLETYWRCHADLITRLDEFDVASKDGTLFGRPRAAELREHEAACRKEIFALSSAAAALVDMARHVTDKFTIPRVQEMLLNNFDGGQHKFIKQLRNKLNHVTVLESDWSIRDRWQGQTSHFEFKAAKLLRYGGFNAEAQSYIRGQQERIDVRNLFEIYGKGVKNFYAWLMLEIETWLPVNVQDYRRCIRARRTYLARSWYRLLFTQVVKPEADLYSYLQTYPTSMELEEINMLPHRSEQQIDRIIEMADEYGACDNELRKLVYKAFGL